MNWGAKMPQMIQGRLREVPLTDIFGLIAAGRKSGVLAITLDEREARIHFEEGRVLYARVEDGPNLGEYLVRLELLSPEEVQELIGRQIQENPHTPLGMMAIRSGIIDEADLKNSLEAQVLDAVIEVLVWSENQRARFNFTERGPEASQVPMPNTLDAQGIMFEAVRRLDEWRRGQVKPHTILVVVGPPSGDKLSLGDWELIHLVDGVRTAASIAAELSIPEGETYRRLFVLAQQGLLREAQVRPEDPWVLIITESQTIRRLVTMTLTRERYRVMLADSLERAKELLAQHHPNTILLDWAEPLEVAKALRTVRGRTHTPIIALVKEEPRIGFFSRFQATNIKFIKKPFKEMELLTAIAGVTHRAV
jgi:CheY-like chemotaxis protein